MHTFLPLLQLLWILASFTTHAQKKNSCTNFISYLFAGISSHCYHNPDLFQDTPDIAIRHTGVQETHYVTTGDGYILALFRIPRTNPRGVILLQHPIAVDSRVWVSQGNSSTAVFFWNAGYDVWMGNTRGCYYSKSHLTLTPKDREFWNFSFHETGLHDVKAFVNLIRNTTGGSKVIILAHSMGTTQNLVYASMRPEEAAANLQMIVNLSPVAYLEHSHPVIRILAPFDPALRIFFDVVGIRSFIPYRGAFIDGIRNFVVSTPLKLPLLLSVLALAGFTPFQFDPQLFNVEASLQPSAASAKTYSHYLQITAARTRFQMYDYGPAKNVRVYGSLRPPLYPLQKIAVPYFTIYSRNDWISDVADNERLYNQIPEGSKSRTVISGLNHIDFHVGRDRQAKVYDRVLQVLSELN